MQSDLDGIFRSLAAVDSTLAAVRERLERLEIDTRNLQSQTANRS